MNCSIFIGCLTVRLQMFVIRHVKLDSLDLKQPIKPLIRAVNNQSYLSILFLTQLLVQLCISLAISLFTETRKYQLRWFKHCLGDICL